MDFIVGLPKSKKGNDSVWVIVDRLTKSAHFILLRTTYTTEAYARIFIREIVQLPLPHLRPMGTVVNRHPRHGNRHTKPMGTVLHPSRLQPCP